MLLALSTEELTFHGVIQAPLLEGKKSILGLKGLAIVKKSDARHLFGGLTQLLAWFAQDV
jgi:hypothetical protein